MPELELRLQVGKYDVQKLLGKGSTGTVYLAKDTFTGREVALKTLEPEVFRDERFGAMHRSQFLNEASLAGKLRHPHIVAILDAVVGEESGHIAMELVTGGDLSQHSKPDTLLPPGDVLQIGFKCCAAMDYAYREQGIVHRDIKPANIMIARGTDIKIADFGAAFLKKSQPAQDGRDGLALLHGAGADARRGADLPQRHLLARRGALRAPGRAPALHRRQARGADREDHARRAEAAERAAADAAARDRRGGAARAEEGARPALRHLGAVRRRALQGDRPRDAGERGRRQREVPRALESRDAAASRRRGVLGARRRGELDAARQGQHPPGRKYAGHELLSSSPRARSRSRRRGVSST